MGTIVAICSSKGGNGKSAITALLSVNLAFAGLRAAVIDADPNGSFSTWHRTTYGGYPALSVSQCIDEDEIVAHALEVSGQHNVTIIDTAGFRNQTASFAMGVASLVLIPVLPDRHSLIEAAKTVRQAESVSQIARRSIPCRILLNAWNPRGLAEQATLDDIESFKLERLPTAIGSYVAMEKYTYSGLVPTSGALGKAALEVIEHIHSLVGIEAWPPPSRANLSRPKS
ncbi:ParA family protein [Acidisphaera sp. L21]|uniref:ParA family protein n=1 Tax=Acidisphaera sp. L21 TaxID=1641851 RepID=UPI00131E60B1|nr:ParA family protein [Acidisphaera sp. L21]